MYRYKININYKLICIIFLIIDVVLFINIFFDKNDEKHKIMAINNKSTVKRSVEETKQDTSENSYISEAERVNSIEQEITIEKKEIVPEVLNTNSGDCYSIIGTIKINKINLEMDISSKTTDELMKHYACRLWGPDVNKKGNLCIIGHNWKNTKLFSKVPTLEIGDKIELIDLNNNSIKYTIYDKYIVNPNNVECLNQETNGEMIVTLITCTDDSSNRYIIHAK
ncbi:MAG: sortase [Candidatus Scatovivens sp.]